MSNDLLVTTVKFTILYGLVCLMSHHISLRIILNNYMRLLHHIHRLLLHWHHLLVLYLCSISLRIWSLLNLIVGLGPWLLINSITHLYWLLVVRHLILMNNFLSGQISHLNTTVIVGWLILNIASSFAHFVDPNLNYKNDNSCLKYNSLITSGLGSS